ncbi:hypothetical protein P7C70_g8527, partial [Phenoliferia sp. Uapishka_3]
MSVFYFGHVLLLRPSTLETIATRSLTQHSLTFGRDSDSDIQIALETCSRTHLTIHVEEEEPYTATAHVNSANGILLNGQRFVKGQVVELEDEDVMDICGRIWKWKGASEETVILNTPAPNRHLAHSIESPAGSPCPSPSPATPSPPVSLQTSILSSLFSPFMSSPQSQPQTQPEIPQLEIEEEEEEKPMVWDNDAERAEDEDLIVWEMEEEVESSSAEKSEAEDEEEEVSPASLSNAIPSTPSLSQRVSSPSLFSHKVYLPRILILLYIFN